jgi:hypothetical protein
MPILNTYIGDDTENSDGASLYEDDGSTDFLTIFHNGVRFMARANATDRS